MPTGVAVGGGMAAAGLISSIIGAEASKSAAGQMSDTIRNQMAQNQQTMQQATPGMQPSITSGTEAAGLLQNGMRPGGSLSRQFTMADFEQSPSYAANLKAALAAIGNSASARGGSLSGRGVTDQINYASNAAGNSFGQAQGEFMKNQQQNAGLLANLQQQGANSAHNLANIGLGLGGQNMIGAGEIASAQGGGIMGASKAIQGGVDNIANGLSAYFNQPGNGAGSASSNAIAAAQQPTMQLGVNGGLGSGYYPSRWRGYGESNPAIINSVSGD